MSAVPSQNRVQVVDRACDILECLADNGPELGVSEITASLGLHKSTVHRLLSTLENRAYVSQRSGDRRYRLGPKLFELGLKVSDTHHLVEHAGPHLERLVVATGETAHLGVLRDGQVLSICAVESPKTLRTPSTVGARSPAHSSSLGKSLLAHLAEEELARIVQGRGLPRQTERTIQDPEELRRELAKVRRRGYAVDNEEREDGLKCIGAPVRDGSGEVMAAVSLAGPANRLGPAAMPVLVQCVKEAAAALSADLGHRGDSN